MRAVRPIDWMTATIIDYPVARMSAGNLTSGMAGNLLEGVAAGGIQS